MDQGQVVYSEEGYNQITIGHFMFRANASLPEYSAESPDEGKHQYVM
jgi:hypothetical protein